MARADHLTMQVQQMAGSFAPSCQMGDPNACGAMSYVLEMEYLMEQAYWACQQGNQMACGVGQQAEGTLLSGYSQWQQANMGDVSGGGAAPAYDPNNVLGPTHQDRMNAIAGFGAANTQAFQERMNGMDAQHEQFMGTLTGP